MAKSSIAQSGARRTRVRAGRPPKELAGEVEQRILEAAHQVFLDRGFEGASIEEIAEVACSGKPTIYARFPNKEALFAAVVMRSIVSRVEQLGAEMPSGDTLEERLSKVANIVLEWVLVRSHVGLIRLAISESRRFPDLAARVGAMARERAGQSLARVFAEIAQSEDVGRLPAFAPDRLVTTTRMFLDLILLPMLMRALVGEDLTSLHAEIESYVKLRVAFFVAACRHLGMVE
jgi:AcrR family transcriptional regulator